MASSTLGGTVNGIARGHILPPCWEGRVSKVLADRLEVVVRSLSGDVQSLAARGWHPQIEDTDDGPVMILPKRGDRAWVANDEGRALVVVAWQRIGESDTIELGPGEPFVLDPTLTALAGLATGANKLAYSTGIDTFAQADFVPRSAYAPTWSSTGTQPAIGNGVLTGSYQRLGGIVDFTIMLVFGTTTTPGTGVYAFTLPVTAGATFRWTGQLDILDSGVQHYNGWWTIAPGGTAFENLLWSSTAQTGTAIQGTSPITFGNLDQITISGRYGV